MFAQLLQMFSHTALQSVFFFFFIPSPQVAVVFVGFDLTGCCKASEGRTVAQVSWN